MGKLQICNVARRQGYSILLLVRNILETFCVDHSKKRKHAELKQFSENGVGLKKLSACKQKQMYSIFW